MPTSVTTHRHDPYRNFKFRVKFDKDYVAGVSKISAFKRTTEVVKHRGGGDESSSVKLPGRTEYEPITLERGVTLDTEFERWANQCWDYRNAQHPMADNEIAIKDFRKDITIDVLNEAGQKVISYLVYNCWVSEYQPLPDLDANANAVAISHIKIENEGWVRDLDVPELPEPSFDGSQ
jgi:phage tail-like protein